MEAFGFMELLMLLLCCDFVARKYLYRVMVLLGTSSSLFHFFIAGAGRRVYIVCACAFATKAAIHVTTWCLDILTYSAVREARTYRVLAVQCLKPIFVYDQSNDT